MANEKDNESIDIFTNEERENVYALAQNYLLLCEELINLCKDKNYKYIKDVQVMKNNLNTAFNAATPVFLEHEKYNAEFDKKVEEIRNRINKN